MSRDAKDLTPETYALWQKFDIAMKANKQRYKLTCTLRTVKEQEELYAQGRTKPGPIVTWTKNSRHLNGEAFDIVMLNIKGELNWDAEAYKLPGRLGEAAGLEWGGRWSKPDYAHLQKSKDK